ncbi:vesicle-associated membrane protein 4 isoform X2 [Siphateles boraxobius]|uniref:vesicle-associated membrane protein 4 isoform X2 n=1 Tax=Siphateles boraxobius TaxID=180520 RepID=UPI00406452DB
MPPKFKRHLNDEEVTGSIRSERRNLLEEDSDEEEDFFLRGPTGPRFGGQNDKIRHVQSQVDEVIDVMQENISKVIERGERLDELQDKSVSDFIIPDPSESCPIFVIRFGSCLGQMDRRVVEISPIPQSDVVFFLFQAKM